MKFKILYISMALSGAAFLFMNNSSGAAEVQGQDRTGSPFSNATCQACHSAGAFSPSLDLEILDGGTPVTSYEPGQAYTMRLTVNATGSPSSYGYQAVALAGGDNMQAGTFQNPGSGQQITMLGGRQYPEQSQRIATNTFEMEWVAPAAGTGEVRFFSSAVAANSAAGSGGDGAATLDSPVVLSEMSPNSTSGIAALQGEIRLFPNPAQDVAQLSLAQAENGRYQIDILSLNGQVVQSSNLQVDGGQATAALDVQRLAVGAYRVRVSHKGKVKALPLIKY